MTEQGAVTFIIADGTCTFLMTEAAPVIEGAVIKRASHVFPRNFVLRILFRILRYWLGDKGRMSEFTRSWNCEWIVDTRPVGGWILRWKDLPHNACMAKYGDTAWGGNEFAVWTNRTEAITAE